MKTRIDETNHMRKLMGLPLLNEQKPDHLMPGQSDNPAVKLDSTKTTQANTTQSKNTQSDEKIVTDYDKSWDYKKSGGKYFTKKKTSEKWTELNPSTNKTAYDAVKTKVFKDTGASSSTTGPSNSTTTPKTDEEEIFKGGRGRGTPKPSDEDSKAVYDEVKKVNPQTLAKTLKSSDGYLNDNEAWAQSVFEAIPDKATYEKVKTALGQDPYKFAQSFMTTSTDYHKNGKTIDGEYSRIMKA